MIWDRQLTAEQAALLAFELDFLKSLELAEKVATLWDKVKDNRTSVAEARNSPLNAMLPKDTPPDWYTKIKSLESAKDLYNALLAEVEVSLSQQLDDSANKPFLEIVSFEKINSSDTLDPTTAQISRESLRNWFLSFGDKIKAGRVYPSVLKSDDQAKKQEQSNSDYKSNLPTDKLIESLGLMALLLCEKVSKYKRANKPNAQAIANDVNELAITIYGLDALDRTGFSNLNKDISSGIKAVVRKMEGNGLN